jgi:shikimate dehydrogenase
VKSITSIGTGTQICAIIGNPVSHSLSPAIHNAAFEALGLDFIYVAFRVEDVENALAGMRALENFRGMSVTIPHKTEAIKYLDEVGDADRAIGSINTVIREEGRLVGLSTDGPGALKAVQDAGVDVDGKNVLMLGSGGAARAIAFTFALRTHPSELLILDIDRHMLDRLTSDLRSNTDVAIKSDLLNDDTLGAAMKRADLIIHCTPVGMYPHHDASLIPAELFLPHQAVLDIVYTPFETQLLAEAQACSVKVIHGVDMFINQAILQFERFTGVDAPSEVMRRVVMENLGS